MSELTSSCLLITVRRIFAFADFDGLLTQFHIGVSFADYVKVLFSDDVAWTSRPCASLLARPSQVIAAYFAVYTVVCHILLTSA